MSKSQALRVGKDGNMFFISCGGCLAHPASKFVFAKTIEQVVRKWNSRTSVHPISLEKATELFLSQNINETNNDHHRIDNR